MYGTDPSGDISLTATPSSDVNVTSQNGTNVTLYIVFGVAFLVFLIIIVVVVKVMRRKNANPNGYTLTSTGKTKGTLKIETLFESTVVRTYNVAFLLKRFYV